MSKRKHPEEVDSMSESKKACNETTFVELSSLEKLPMEVLEVICSFISCSEILELMLTSKAINSTIAESSRVMDRFKISFEHINEAINGNFQSISKRKYSSIVIPFIRQNDLHKASTQLKKYGERIKEITFVDRFSTKVVSKILQVCKNVRKINANNIRTSDQKSRSKNDLYFWNYHYANESQAEASALWEKELAFDPSPLDLPRLKSLDCFILGPEFNLFSNCQLKEINISVGENFVNAWRLKKFLDKQDSLEIMRISGSNIFHADLISKVKFKLKELVFTQKWNFNDGYYRNHIQTFVNQHKESLVHVSARLSLLKLFAECKLLKIVNITAYDYTTQKLAPMPQVEILSVILSSQAQIRTSLKDVFPNLKELRVKLDGSSKPPFNFMGFGKMATIEKLTLESSNVNKLCLNMLNLESLTLIDCKFPQRLIPAGIEPFIQIRLPKLTIKKCSELNWIMDIINSDFVIEHLKLESLKLPKSIHQAIINNPHKVHQLLVERVQIDENA